MTEEEFTALARTMLERDEGKTRRVYPDSRGIMTVGIGHNLQAVDLSDKAINQIFADDLFTAAFAMRRVFGDETLTKLSLNRKLAICNMIFNLGEGGFIRFKELIKAIKEERFDDAASECFKSRWAYQVDDGPGGKPGMADRVAFMLAKDKFPY